MKHIKQIFSYSWDLTTLGTTDCTSQEFRFGEAEPVKTNDERIPDFELESVFSEPSWLNNEEEVDQE